MPAYPAPITVLPENKELVTSPEIVIPNPLYAPYDLTGELKILSLIVTLSLSETTIPLLGLLIMLF